MNPSRRGLFLFISLVAVLSIALAACSGDDDNGDDPGDEAPVATATPADEVEATTPPEVEDTDGDVEAGRSIWQAQCMACHTIDGSDGLGPTWQGLWMSDVPLEDGSTVTADEAYITESIRDPNAQIHEGFQAVMPAFDLSDEEVADVIAFIQSLD